MVPALLLENGRLGQIAHLLQDLQVPAAPGNRRQVCSGLLEDDLEARVEAWGEVRESAGDIPRPEAGLEAVPQGLEAGGDAIGILHVHDRGRCVLGALGVGGPQGGEQEGRGGIGRRRPGEAGGRGPKGPRPGLVQLEADQGWPRLVEHLPGDPQGGHAALGSRQERDPLGRRWRSSSSPPGVHRSPVKYRDCLLANTRSTGQATRTGLRPTYRHRPYGIRMR